METKPVKEEKPKDEEVSTLSDGPGSNPPTPPPPPPPGQP